MKASIPNLWKQILLQKDMGDKEPTGLDKVESSIKLSKMISWCIVMYFSSGSVPQYGIDIISIN